MKSQTTKIEKHFDSVRLMPNTLNDDKRTVEMIFTTSKPVRMIGWTDKGFEEFKETLSMDIKHVDLERMKKGAPLLDSHNRFEGLSKQLGVVEDVWIEGEELKGRVRFSKREDVEPYYQDVKDGIIKNASIGYRVYKYEDISEDNDKIRTLKATSWEPHEISLVTVPADSDAQVKSKATNEKNECEVKLKIKSEEQMPPVNENEKVTQAELDKAKAQEREKAAKIIRACRQAGLDDKLAEEIIDGGHSYARSLEIIQEKWAEKDTATPQPETPAVDDIEITEDQREKDCEAISDAIIFRQDPRAVKDEKIKGNPHRDLTAIDICKYVVEKAGFNTKNMGRNQIIKKAFHSTSDFTNILENVASKRLQMGYESVPQVWRRFMNEEVLRDFKQSSIVHLDEAPALEKIGEAAEIKYGTMGDSKEVWQLATYAKGLSVTRETIINDDLNAFSKLNMSFGRSAAHLENQVALKNQILDNPNMGDAVALFHASHSNLGTAGALSETTLSEMEQLISDQTDTKGRELELAPAFLLVGTDNRTTAKKLLATQSVQGGFNVFGDEFELLVSSLVPAGEYYMIANPNQIENVSYAYLEGARGLQIESENTFDILGVKVRAYLDFAAKVVNHRSMVKNAGA